MFHSAVSEWFEQHIGKPSPPQTEGWPAIARGEHVLIAAPTGSGKTLAAFLESINHLLEQGLQEGLNDEVQVLYISPLKALNNDIYRNLEVPLQGIAQVCEQQGLSFPDIRKGVRTGDTPARERQRMLRKPPHILITTPESLYLLLTSQKASRMLRRVRCVIVDEIHALLDNKRGVHLALSLERLAALTEKPFQRIGLSATVKPLELATRYLGGWDYVGEERQPRPVTLVVPSMPKAIDLKVNVPVKDMRVLPEGSIWPEIYQSVLQMVLEHRSTLVFVNNRAVAEKMAHNLNQLAGRELAKAHHGCVSREARLAVEEELKSGKLPCLVATSSLELGIDVGAIDLMVQVSSPKSVARGLQRLGRAGHRLDAVSRGRILPRTRADLLESVIVAQEMAAGNLEAATMPENCLDVLAQQLVAMASEREWTAADMLQLVHRATPYYNLAPAEFERTLAMLAGDFEHQADVPRAPRLIWDRINGLVRGNNYSRLLAISSGGTIPDQGHYGVYLGEKGVRLGELDEVFVFEARRGERFMLGTSAWRIERIEKDRVIVSPCSTVGARIPFWNGEGLGRPYEFGRRYAARLRELGERANQPGFVSWLAEQAPVEVGAASNLQNYLLAQTHALEELPTDKRIVVEHFADETGDSRVAIHCPFGGRVNAGLAILLEQMAAQQLNCQVQAVHNDDGVLLHLYGATEPPYGLLNSLTPEHAERQLLEFLPTTPLFSITFRHIANRALMMGVRRQGKRLPLWVQRTRALEALQLAMDYRDHPLVIETYRECLETALDVPGLLEVLSQISAGEIEVREMGGNEPSPFASELLFSFTALVMYEGLLPSPKKPSRPVFSSRQALHLRYASPGEKLLWEVEDIEAVRQQTGVAGRLEATETADELHSLVRMFGDLHERQLGQSGASVFGLLAELEGQGRLSAQGSEGERVWIAAEDEEFYQSVLQEYDQGALLRLVRRYARFYSPFLSREISERYSLPEKLVQGTLQLLQDNGQLVAGHFSSTQEQEWCHVAVLERIRRQSLKRRRAVVSSQQPQVYAHFLTSWQGVAQRADSSPEAIYKVIRQLERLPLPVSWWEDFIFPQRLKSYRPAHLDQLCQSGRITWRVSGDSSPRLAWYLAESLQEEREVPAAGDLSGAEQLVFQALCQRGASFLHALAAETDLSTASLLNALQNLVWQGLVCNDSFQPVRYFLESNPTQGKAKAKRRAVAYRPEMGRWEVARAVRPYALERQIDLLLERYGLLAKELVDKDGGPYLWSEIYDELERLEFIGKVQRGYYVEGLSGRQFLLPAAEATLQPSEATELTVLIAADPAQPYGRLLPHIAGLSWTAVPSTAVVLSAGSPVLLAERHAERLSVAPGVDDKLCLEAIAALVAAWHQGRLWRNLRKLTLKQIQAEPAAQSPLQGELAKLGFLREMQDLVLWRKL